MIYIIIIVFNGIIIIRLMYKYIFKFFGKIQSKLKFSKYFGFCHFFFIQKNLNNNLILKQVNNILIVKYNNMYYNNGM